MVTTSLLASHFIGVIISSVFYGFTLAQTWYYYRTYTNDSVSMKTLVAFLWLLDTAQLILVVASVYHYSIVWKGDYIVMSHISRTFEAAMAVSSIVAFLVQLTYALRIWRLSFNNMHLTIPIVVLAFVGLACGGGMIAKTIKDPSWDHTRVSNLPASLFYFSSIACDILIAASQVYLFHKSRTGIGRLGGLITKLTVLVVNVGLITSLDVTVFLILFLVCPHNGAFLVPYILMSHCYLNSFLSVLNSRILLRELVEVDNFVCPEFTFATISVPGSRATSQSLPCTRTDVCSVLGTDSNPASLVLSVEP